MSAFRFLFNSQLLPSTIVWWSWFAAFGVLELLAVFKNKSWMPIHVPWTPLSDYIWALEDHVLWLPYAIIAGFAALLVHLVVKKFH